MLSLSSSPSPQSSSPSQIQCLEIHFCAEQANWFQEQEESKNQTKVSVVGAKENKKCLRPSSDRSECENVIIYTLLKPTTL